MRSKDSPVSMLDSVLTMEIRFDFEKPVMTETVHGQYYNYYSVIWELITIKGYSFR